MEEKDILLFEAKFDAGDAQQKVVVFKQALIELNKQRAELNKLFRDNKIGAAEYAKQLDAVDKASKTAKDGIKSNTKALEDQAKIEQAATGSIVQLRAQLSALTAGYIELPAAIRDGTKEGVAQQRQIKAVTDELKEQEERLGDHHRSVGDYAKGIAGSTEATSVFAEKIGSLKEKLETAKSGFEAAKFGLTGLKGAIAATGIGLLLLALNALYGYFTRNKEGADAVAKAFRVVGSVVSFLEDKVADIGKSIVEAFSNPAEAVKKFGNLIEENILNRFRAFGVLFDAIKRGDSKALVNGFIQLGTGVTDATGKVSALKTEIQGAVDKDEALFQANKRLADSEQALNIQRAQSSARINALNLLAADSTKSIKDRINAAQQAFSIENGITKKQIELEKQRLNLLSQKPDTDEDKDGAIADAKIKLATVQAESLAAQKKLQSTLIELRNEGARQLLDVQIATLNENLRITKERGFQTLEIEKQILAKELALSLVGVVKGSEQEKALRLKYKGDLAQLILNDVIADNERLTRIETDQINAEIDLVQKGTLAELDLQRKAIRQREFEEETSARLTIKNQEELEARLTAIHAKATADKKAVDKAAAELDIKDQADRADTLLARSKVGSRAELDARIAQIRAGAKEEILQAGNNATAIEAIYAKMNRAIDDTRRAFVEAQVQQVVDLSTQAAEGLGKIFDAQAQRTTDLLDQQQKAALSSTALSSEQRERIQASFDKKREKAEREAAEKRRKIQTVENIIQIASGLITAQKEPFPLNLIKSGLVLLTGAAQQAVIASQKFEYGGVTEGESHARGGIKYRIGKRRVELEGGEGVINKRSMAIPGVREKASALNELGGGVRFPGVRASGSYTSRPVYADGGLTPSQQIDLVNQTASLDYTKLGKVVSSMVLTAVQGLPAPEIQIKTVRDGINKVSKVEARANA